MTNMIYALVGPHAAGKGTLASQLIAMGINFIPTYVTAAQAKAPVKQDNPLYKAVSPEDFKKLDLIVRYTHKGEIYGICKQDLLNSLDNHRISVMLLETTGMQQLKRLLKKKLATIYLMVDYVSLVDRMLKMNSTNDEIKYHLQYAENNKEFESWKFTDHVIKNTGEMQQASVQLLAIMGLSTVVAESKFRELTN